MGQNVLYDGNFEFCHGSINLRLFSSSSSSSIQAFRRNSNEAILTIYILACYMVFAERSCCAYLTLN